MFEAKFFRLFIVLFFITIFASNSARSQQRESKNSALFIGNLQNSAHENDHWSISGSIQLPKVSENSVNLGTLIPIVLALLGIAGAYWNSVSTEKRKAQILFVNEQLKDLYGPLFALSRSSEAAWNKFRVKYRPGGAFFDPKNPPTQFQLDVWVLWMKTVFFPINDKMIKAIVDHSHLIEGDKMPSSFTELIAHVEGYRVIISQWEKGDFSSYTSLINFPLEFSNEITHRFEELQKRQRKLMGQL